MMPKPDPDHFRKFTNRLELMEEKRFRLYKPGFLLKIAAAVLLFLATSILILDLTIPGLRNRMAPQTASVTFPSDIRDALRYYSQQASEGIHDINRLAASGEEARQLRDMTLNDLRSLDANTAELTKSLPGEPG